MNNYLTKFPLLESSKKLKTLNLNNNKLENINDIIPTFTPILDDL
jgi:hypothetical protein